MNNRTMLTDTTPIPQPIDIQVGVRDMPIYGKMVSAQMKISAIQAVQSAYYDNREFIKRELAQQLVKYLIENNMIEYTVQQYTTDDSKLVRARVFVTPDDQTRMLRIYAK